MMAIAIRMQVFDTNFPFRLSLLEDGEELTFRKRKRELTAIYRKKAEMAIKALTHEEDSLPKSHTYFCTIDDNFRFKREKKELADYGIDVTWSEDLTISVTPLRSNLINEPTCIFITPRDGKWSLGVEKVVLKINSELGPGLTVAWKAFEQELIVNAIKADLVQLNGYYQYPPKLVIDAHISDNEKYSHVLESIMSNRDIPIIKDSEVLAAEWTIPKENVMDAAEYLRKLGYEIRNHATNPQIPDGKWLIPYAFPTLTPLSVQLWKKLQ